MRAAGWCEPRKTGASLRAFGFGPGSMPSLVPVLFIKDPVYQLFGIARAMRQSSSSARLTLNGSFIFGEKGERERLDKSITTSVQSCQKKL